MGNPGDVMLSEIAEIPQILGEIASEFETRSDIHSLLNEKKFQSVVIVARGTSDNAAHFLKYLIETQLGLPCGLASPSVATMYKTKFRYEKTLVVAISQSGKSSDLAAFSQAAKDGGGYLLSITNNSNSPLALLSEAHLSVQAGPELAVPATKSYVGQLMVSYLLVMSWAMAKSEVKELIKNAQATVDDESSYLTFARNISIKKPIYVLGRGFSYPNAKEFALKLQETSLIPVQGMSTSDFLHGPIASITEDSQVIFISPNGLPEDSFGDTPTRVRAITKRLFWIGNNGANQGDDVVLHTPHSSSEILASITDAIAFQKVTHYLATSNGLDPDSPKGLSKVTITL